MFRQFETSLRAKRIVLFFLYVLISVYIFALLALGFKISWEISLTPILTFSFFIFPVFFSSQLEQWIKVLAFCVLAIYTGLLFESIGVFTGLIYGPYHYTDQLGNKFLGLVPFLIPAAWMVMTYPSMVIAKVLIPTTWSGTKRMFSIAALSGVIMTAWDVVMDPMMVLRGNWVWEVRGAYFGIPLMNFLGWWATTFAVVLLFLSITQKMPVTVPIISDRWAVIVYCFFGLVSLVTCLLIQLERAALAGLIAMLPWMVLGWWKTSQEKYSGGYYAASHEENFPVSK